MLEFLRKHRNKIILPFSLLIYGIFFLLNTTDIYFSALSIFSPVEKVITEITKEIGRVIVTNSIVKSVDIFYYTGFFFNRLFSLIGFYIIYKIPSRKIFSGDFFLALVLIFIISTLANEWFYIYHITALALLILIINNYYQTYKNEKITNTKILISAFIILAISQILFLMSSINYMYVTAQSVQLVSYITLFFLVIKIIQNGKKKN